MKKNNCLLCIKRTKYRVKYVTKNDAFYISLYQTVKCYGSETFEGIHLLIVSDSFVVVIMSLKYLICKSNWTFIIVEA